MVVTKMKWARKGLLDFGPKVCSSFSVTLRQRIKWFVQCQQVLNTPYHCSQLNRGILKILRLLKQKLLQIGQHQTQVVRSPPQIGAGARISKRQGKSLIGGSFCGYLMGKPCWLPVNWLPTDPAGIGGSCLGCILGGLLGWPGIGQRLLL